MQGFELNHDRLGMQAGLEILGVPTRRQSSYEAAPPAVASVFAGDGTLSLFNMKQSDPLQHSVMGFQLRLRDSRYWRPAQDLLREFCSLVEESSSAKKRPRKAVEPEEGKAKFLWCESMDLLELQKMRARLVLMLVEVDKRYARYAEHMRAAVEPFEAVAGAGAASDYSALASRAMSRHFRCLRDAIAGQTAAVRQAIADKGGLAAPTRGETPRLKLLDQCMRQRRALHQGLLEPHPWRPQRGLPERAVTLLRAWLFEHFLHPYPNDGDKLILARQTGLSRNQVSNWFINARVRLWKPMVEEMYMEEMKELDHHLSDQSATGQQDIGTPHNPNPSSCGLLFDDRKPLPPPPAVQLLDDSESVLSSIINSRNLFRADNYELLAGDLGFSCSNSSGGGGGSSRRAGVSLTLGLQHHNGGGMSLSLLPKSHQRVNVNDDEDDEEQVLHFSILDGEAVSLPYRNLMGAQLLHDLAG